MTNSINDPYTPEDKIQEIKKYGKKAIGRADLLKFYRGRQLSPTQSIKAMCYDCGGYGSDFIGDCENELCPLHPHMPYAKRKPPTKPVQRLSASNPGQSDETTATLKKRPDRTPGIGMA